MDRYVIRERRLGAEYPEGNHMIAFSATSTGNNITMPEQVFCRPCNTDNPNINMHLGAPGLVALQGPSYPSNVSQPQGQIVPGIDPRYIAAYNDNSAGYIATGQLHREYEYTQIGVNAFGSDYQNRNFIGAERTENKRYAPQRISNAQVAHMTNPISYATASPQTTNSNISIENQLQRKHTEAQVAHMTNPISYATASPQTINSNISIENQLQRKHTEAQVAHMTNPGSYATASPQTTNSNISIENQLQRKHTEETSKKQTEIDLLKNEVKHQVKIRSEKLKELQKSGIRVFSGPVENILKWHKSLQDVGVMVLYEIVGKCVSVRAGESCAKNLVVRDDNGPAIQVVYYEIDFLLPELKIPCFIRAIGRIMPGTSRLQAFSVRPATGDDISILPRRAAVASHHVAKLCKEYSQKNN